MDNSRLCALPSLDAFLAAILDQPNPSSVDAFVAEILGENNPGTAAAFAADILREHNFNPDEPRDERGRWTTGGSHADGLNAIMYGTPETSPRPASNPQTGVYQIGGGHNGSLNIMSDSYLNRGAVNPASANTVVAAARGAGDRIDRAIDLLENNYPQVQTIMGPATPFNLENPSDVGRLRSEEGRNQMLSQLRTVRNAFNNPSVYTNIVLDSANSGLTQNRKGYVDFLARDAWPQFSTNIVTSFIPDYSPAERC
jgi:hypothetical protein